MRPIATTVAVLACAMLAGPAVAEHHEEQHARTEAFAGLPYWPGYWVSEHQAGTTITGLAPIFTEPNPDLSNFANVMSLRADTANWNEEGQRRVDHVRAISGGRKANGWGFPMMMNSATPLRFLITPEETIIINAYNEARYIYTDGRDMPDELDMWPTTYGTSVGHWEGDTLVIETAMVQTPSDYFHGAPPFSEEARYEERIRMDGDRLVAEFKVTDPVTLNEPFTSSISWVRDEGFDRMIVIDWDNDRTGNDGQFNTIEPNAVD
ncbi:hypothetical protein [Alteraurantiacibacter aquimixticola]|uniref:Uncharacterized protein n=1 Tax=Alteraurantiacibacter aquimixticola TaxID=2489173 RepID=A0A4T3F5V1_9SPHN|nr:hypothetical protein [Alteraurantiacibacter aquimixticola]TIX51774.1 hypothetical protein E5222_04830 [Alteraurantiacibacter aquimixticola]